MRCIALLFVTVRLLGDVACAAEPQLPRAIPCFRLQINIAEASAFSKEFAAALEASDNLASVLEISESVTDGQLKPNAQVMYQYNLFTSRAGVLVDMAYPADLISATDAAGEAALLAESADYLVLAVFISDDDHDSEPVRSAYSKNGQDVLNHITRHPTSDALRFEVLPSKLKSTHVESQLRAQMAAALTTAQQRDGELASTYALRSAVAQFGVDVAAMCLSDLESFAIGVGQDSDKQTVQVQCRSQVHQRSKLHELVGELGQRRNRVLSYLHPANNGYLAVSLPVPGLVADALGQSGLQGSLMGPLVLLLPPASHVPESRLIASICESNTLEFIAQSFEGPDGASALMYVVPLQGGTTGAFSGLTEGRTGLDVDGHPVVQIPGADLKISGQDFGTYLVETDSCFGLMICTRPALRLLAESIRRDFREHPAARQFSRSIATADFPLNNTVVQHLYDLEDLFPAITTEESPQARVQMHLAIDGDQILLTSNFEKDAAVVGMQLWDVAIGAIVGGLERLIDPD